MKPPRLRITPEAGRPISQFPPGGKRLIRAALEELRMDPQKGHDLHEELSGFKSMRSGRYRILYRLNEEEGWVDIYHVAHRRDVYDQFRRLLKRLRGD